MKYNMRKKVESMVVVIMLMVVILMFSWFER